MILLFIISQKYQLFFSIVGLKISDDVLESELRKIKSNQGGLPDTLPVSLASKHGQANENENKNEESKESLLMKTLSTSNATSTSIVSTHHTGSTDFDTANIPPYDLNINTTNAMHPLKALLYLKLLCVHPCLVISKEKYAPYYEHLQVRSYSMVAI